METWLPKPDVFMLAAASSEGITELNAFDSCLLKAGIGNTNLIKLSSIIPPGCTEVESINLPAGAALPTAYAYIASDMPGEIISAAIAVVLPKDESAPGLIMEYSARGRKEDIERIVRRMGEEGMRIRGQEIASIKTIAAEHMVERIGVAFAGVVLWNSKL